MSDLTTPLKRLDSKLKNSMLSSRQVSNQLIPKLQLSKSSKEAVLSQPNSKPSWTRTSTILSERWAMLEHSLKEFHKLKNLLTRSDQALQPLSKPPRLELSLLVPVPLPDSALLLSREIWQLLSKMPHQWKWLMRLLQVLRLTPTIFNQE